MDAAELRAWQKRLRYSNRQAADRVGLSVWAYCRQCTGAAPVGRQTALLCDYIMAFELCGVELAETAIAFARKLRQAR